MVWDEGESYTAKVHRGEIIIYKQRYNNYTEIKKFLSNAFQIDFYEFEYKCTILVEILYYERSFKMLKIFLDLLFQKDYPIRKKLSFILQKLFVYIKKNIVKNLHN